MGRAAKKARCVTPPTKETAPVARLNLLYFKSRAEWRSWLERNHHKAREAWLAHYKQATGLPSVSYEEAVKEALCFGWVDGKKKSVDKEKYAYRYTPRASRSTWSALNIARTKKLIQDGRMMAAGLQAFEGHEKRRNAPLPTKLPKKLQALFEANKSAWNNFKQSSPAYRRLCIGWVASAKQETTQLRRLKMVIDHSAKNAKIKFM